MLNNVAAHFSVYGRDYKQHKHKYFEVLDALPAMLTLGRPETLGAIGSLSKIDIHHYPTRTTARDSITSSPRRRLE
jgi:hypothetical protein